MAEQTPGNTRGDAPASLGVRGWRVYLWSGRGAGVGSAAHGRNFEGSSRQSALVQPLRSAARMAGDDAPSRGGRFFLLQALLHGAGARRRLSETRVQTLPEVCSGSWYLPVVSF